MLKDLETPYIIYIIQYLDTNVLFASRANELILLASLINSRL